MYGLLVISLATAFVITAIEGLFVPLGKWRGLVALIMSSLGAVFALGLNYGMLVFTSLASSFLSMVISLLVTNLLESQDPRTLRGLPRRVPPL